MEIRIDGQALDRLDENLAEALRRTPESKREVLTDLGEQLLSQVRANIGGAGKVRKWQHTHVGDKGGYVAVHPVERTEDPYGRAVGAVTNAIESGHKIRPPGGKAKRYVPRIKVYRVPGKGMYDRTDPERAAEASAQQLERRLAEDWGE